MASRKVNQQAALHRVRLPRVLLRMRSSQRASGTRTWRSHSTTGRSSPSMAARASSAATWCGPLAKTGARMRVAVQAARARRPPPAAWRRRPDQCRCRPMCAFPIRCSRCGRRRCGRSISSASCFRPASRPSRRCRTRARAHVAEAARAAGARSAGACVGDRRRAPTRRRPMRAARRRASRRCATVYPDAVDSAAVHRVRAGGRFLQPLRGARAHRAGPAADRRRQDADSSRCSPATWPRRSSPALDRQDQARRALRARRARRC